MVEIALRTESVVKLRSGEVPVVVVSASDQLNDGIARLRGPEVNDRAVLLMGPMRFKPRAEVLRRIGELGVEIEPLHRSDFVGASELSRGFNTIVLFVSPVVVPLRLAWTRVLGLTGRSAKSYLLTNCSQLTEPTE